ncbi:MAG: CpsB/CapC family capsule biosynthesis tyrosine phosphatase [Cyclobacteriaceae bacterium]
MAFSLFKKKKITSFLTTDVHSHLLPGIDDGVKSFDESISIIQELQALGLKKIITTPHIIADYYPNTPEIIRGKLQELRQILTDENMDIQVEAAAEYQIDEGFMAMLESGQELLTFGEGFVLVETPFLNKPLFIDEALFKLKSLGYHPVLAHPERYIYLQEDYAEIKTLIDSNIHLQISLGSLAGYYSHKARKLAQYLIDHQWISFIGSDIHHSRHLEAYKKAHSSKYFEKCRQLFLYNNTL